MMGVRWCSPATRAARLHRENFNKRVRWVENVAAICAPGLHVHDLRHTGDTFAAMSGACLRDLMTRMGHDSMRAALIYQHKTQGADRKIADCLEALIQRHRDSAGDAGQPSS
jgi:integrase